MERVFADASLPEGRDSDAEDASSGYSSCEGSEFERYCSANSVLGSASQCGSVGSYSEFLDSAKNPAERDNFRWSRWSGDASISGGFDCLSDGGVESPRVNGCSNGMNQFPRIRTGTKISLSSNENSSSCKGDCSTEEVIGDGCLPCPPVCEEKLDFDKNLGADFTGFASDHHIGSGMMLEADDNASSRCECSEDEDSMLDYGTDEEGIQLFERNNLQYVKGTEPKNENPLLINASVAFGSNDWDEFMQESGGNGFLPLSLYQNQAVQQQQEPLRVHEGMDDHKPLAEECSQEGNVNSRYDGPGRDIQHVGSEGVYDIDTDRASEKQVICQSDLLRAPLSDSPSLQSYSALSKLSQGKEVGTQEFDSTRSFQPANKNGHNSSVERVVEGNSNSTDMFEVDPILDEVKNLDTTDSCDEMVLEMEEILLDSGKSHGARYTLANQGYITQQSHHIRDGSSTASTSGTEDACPRVHCPVKIDWIEVVGAKQKQGDVSFGERLVGVKEYTVYKLRVWSGEDQWEVERRYRDFYALYRQLKTLFTDHGLNLPSPWSNIERDSRKIFGNASPSVINERSGLIQNCLRSILNARYPFGTPNSLVDFLSSSKAIHSSGLLKALIPQYLQRLGQDEKSTSSNCEENCSEDISMFGKTISLVVEIKPHRSIRQLLEAQQYTCAGCHRHLDAGKTLLREIVQTLGWNKSRFCEYTGQLFCASCHTNDTTVLPARVLHLWDFSLYPVSQLAKAYLESVYDQPMLCVSAVNPFLFSKVPALLHVVSIRKKIGAMLPYVRCPFRRSIQRGLGLRRHLLESNDFFALRDLVDLSKGAFAALPIMLETISNKIFEHISQQCLECYDAGVPCAARHACDDPSSLIFPFQEADAAKCGLCGSAFHKPCFGKLMGCPCSKLTIATAEQASYGAGKGPTGVSERSIQPPDSSPTSGFFSDILSKARPDKIWKPKNRSPVILMGSLPSSSL